MCGKALPALLTLWAPEQLGALFLVEGVGATYFDKSVRGASRWNNDASSLNSDLRKARNIPYHFGLTNLILVTTVRHGMSNMLCGLRRRRVS
jgi:hypothetical protein